MRGDAQASLDRMGNSAERAGQALGLLADKLGVTAFNDWMAGQIENAVKNPMSMVKWLGITPLGEEIIKATGKLINYQQPNMRAPGASGPAGATQRDAERSSMKALREHPNDVEDALEDARRDRAARAINGRGDASSEDLATSAKQAMDGYNKELAAGGNDAIGVTMSFVEKLKSMLNFTAGPTIKPNLVMPGSPTTPAAPSPAKPEQHSSLAPTGKVSLAQNFYNSNSRAAARAAIREQNRSIRMAQARALHDLGSVA
jgi:hypothetical protein